MTGLSISDILAGDDILEKTGLRPIWETVKVYLLRALLIVSLIITVTNIASNPIQCTGIRSSNVTLSMAEINFVGKLCSQKLNYHDRYPGFLAILFSTVLYILSNWWKLAPTVRSGFLAVKKVNEKLGSKNVSSIRIRDMVTMPHRSNPSQGHADQTNANRDHNDMHTNRQDGLKVVCDCCRILLFREEKWTIPVYFYSSTITCLAFAIASITKTHNFWLADHAQKITFACNITDAESNINIKEFSCSNDKATQLLPYMGFFLAIQILLVIILSCTGLFLFQRLRNIKEHEKSTKAAQNQLKDYNLIKLFNDWSQKLNEKTIWLISNQYTIISSLEQKQRLAVEYWDREFLCLGVQMHKDCEEKLLSEIGKKLSENPESISLEQVQGFPSLFQIAAAHHKFELFIKLHDILVKERSDAENSIFLSCGCEQLNLSEVNANKLLEMSILQRNLEVRRTYHIAYWLRNANDKIRVNPYIQNLIVHDYTGINLQNLLSHLVKCRLLTVREQESLQDRDYRRTANETRNYSATGMHNITETESERQGLVSQTDIYR